MNRQNRKSIAEETIRIVARGEYVSSAGSRVMIAGAVSAAVNGTRVFTPEELCCLLKRAHVSATDETIFDVRNETTLSAARRLVADHGLEDVLCLNFASAKNPGGGFLGGSQAQEESLARASALYATLQTAARYYEINRACGTALYTDHMILSPNVPVFRDDDGRLLDEPYELTFVTAPAVNAGAVTQNEHHRSDQIVPTMRRRITMLLALAESKGYRHLILGAWGCGVFRNDPSQIAHLFAEQLLDHNGYAGRFATVVFAVLDRTNGGIIQPFGRIFAGVRKGA